MSPLALILILLACAAWLGLAMLSRRLTDNPRGDELTGLLLRVTRIYAHSFQRLRVEGLENIPPTRRNARGEVEVIDGPLIVVSNHTAGVDPALIQAVLPFEVRWMMGRDMMTPLLEPLWQFGRVIGVNRGQRDAAALREALAHLDSGGVLGIFPEGGIESPRRTLLPFQPGIGLLARQHRARILPIVIDGTAGAGSAYASLIRRGRCRVRIMPVITLDPAVETRAIAGDLQKRYEAWTGWRVRPPSDRRDESR